MKPRFATLVVDVDSTLSGVEGIDWLAERRGPAVADVVREQTRRAMEGELPLEAVYAARLETVAPGRHDVEALGRAYVARLAPGAADVLRAVAAAGVRVELVSGGLRPAVLAVAAACGVAPGQVHAVDVRFDARGGYAGFDAASPLARSGGKPAVLRALSPARPVLAVGDGGTDLEMKLAGTVDSFAAFARFTHRAGVVAAADHVVDGFGAVRNLVLGESDW